MTTPLETINVSFKRPMYINVHWSCPTQIFVSLPACCCWCCSVVILLLLFNNTLIACLNSRTVKRWFSKKGGRLKPDKSAKEWENLLKGSGPHILVDVDKNAKQALRKAESGLKSTVSLPGAVSYFAVASLVLVVDGGTSGGQFDKPWVGGINNPRKPCSCCSGGNCFGGSYRNCGCDSGEVAYRSRSGDCEELKVQQFRRRLDD